MALPNPNPIPNNARVVFTYTIDPSVPDGGNGTSSSNTVGTQVNSASLQSQSKTVDKAFANVGEILTFTITLANNGNVTANNVIITDTIPTNTTFELQSVVINNVANTSTVPQGNILRINVGNIAVNSLATLVFKVKVATIPSPNPIPNSANAAFTFTVDPAVPNGNRDQTNTNITATQVNNANLGNASKKVNRVTANVGHILTYTITLPNIGNVTADNVIIIDTIPNGTSFEPQSVIINNTPDTATVPVGNTLIIDMGNIASRAVSTLVYQVRVDTIPSPNPIPNSANASYMFTVDPSFPDGVSTQSNTNTVNTRVSNANLGNSYKTVNKPFANVGDVLTYNIYLPNVGNTTANNVIIIDTIPNNTTFELQSVVINNVPNTATVPVGNVLRINMGSVGINGISTLSYRVKVTTIPNPNPIPNSGYINYTFTIDQATPNSESSQLNTNVVDTQVNNANLGNTYKITDKKFADINDVITYTITLPNVGNVTANNVYIIDTIPNGTSFEPQSVIINNVPDTVTVPVGNTLRVDMGSIAPGDVSTLVYQVRLNTVPNPNPIPNSANVSFRFTVDPSVPNGIGSQLNTNIVRTQFNNANLGTVLKTVNKLYATCGDVLTYTISIPNVGNVTATNVVLQDSIPSGTIFVPNSVMLNGVLLPAGTNPEVGINVGTIPIGGVATISFKTTVTCIYSP